MVILAEFNNKSVKELLDRCWQIVMGNALDKDIEHKMICHPCTSPDKGCEEIMQEGLRREYGVWPTTLLFSLVSFGNSTKIILQWAEYYIRIPFYNIIL